MLQLALDEHQKQVEFHLLDLLFLGWHIVENSAKSMWNGWDRIAVIILRVHPHFPSTFMKNGFARAVEPSLLHISVPLPARSPENGVIS